MRRVPKGKLKQIYRRCLRLENINFIFSIVLKGFWRERYFEGTRRCRPPQGEALQVRRVSKGKAN